MMKFPKVSVLVLAHDNTAGLAATVASLAEQRQVVVEPVVLSRPSGGPDRLHRLQHPAGSHPVPIILPLAEHEPLGAAMARGYDRATGNWIGWLQAGDTLAPDTLASLFEKVAARPAKALGLCGQPDIAGLDGLALVGRMAGGRAAAAGLIAPREWIRTVGGFDRELDRLAPLAMIARLVGRFPLVFAPAAVLCPWQLNNPADRGGANLSRKDRAGHVDIAIRLLSDFLGVKSPSPLSRGLILEIYRHLYDGTRPDLLAMLGRSMARTIRPEDLTVVLLGTCKLSASALGVAGARVIRIPQPVDMMEELLEQLSGQSSAHVVAIDSIRPPAVPVLATQLLCQIAHASAACFPPEDEADPHRSSLLPGTILQSHALTAELIEDPGQGEGPFWYALQRHGSLEMCPTIPVEPSTGDGSRGWLPSTGIDPQAAELVDRIWYSQCYPDRHRPDLDPANHYLTIGWKEGFDPNPWFRTTWYAETNGIQQNGTGGDGCPLLHFVRIGAAEGRLPHPGLNLPWYALRYLGSAPDVAAFRYFLDVGLSVGHVPEQIMDDSATLQAVQRLSRSERTVAAFARLREDRQRLIAEITADLVDQEWYRQQYPDVAGSGVDPTWHYLTYGWREGRSPNDWFSPTWYEALAISGPQAISPLEHFVSYGAGVGCRPCPEFDGVWYTKQYLGKSSPTAEALSHFLAAGLESGAVPDPLLHGPGLRTVLLRTPLGERSGLIKRLWSLRHRSCGHSPFLQNADIGDWTLLLQLRKPPGTETVLLLLDPHTAGLAQRVELAGRVLPPHETPLLVLIHGIDRIEIRDRLEADAVSVSVVPTEARPFLRELRATWTLMVDPGLASSPAGMALVNAGLPLTATRDGR